MDTATDLEVGAALVAALTQRDFQGMAAMMAPGSHFRALLPGRVVDADGDGGEVFAAELDSWFGGPDALEVEDASVGRVGHRTYLRWRVRMTPPTGPARIVEQHVFVTGDVGIRRLDLLCSGFQPVREPVAS